MRNGRGVNYFYYAFFITGTINVRVAQSPTAADELARGQS